MRPRHRRTRGGPRGLSLARRRGPIRGRPLETELRGRNPHAQLERPPAVHDGIPERDLNRKPVQQSREADGEVVGVDRAELPVGLTFANDGAQRLAPVLVEFLAYPGDGRMPGGLGPEIEPERPRVRRVVLVGREARRARRSPRVVPWRWRSPPCALRRGRRRRPPRSAWPRSASCPWCRSNR